MFLGGDCDDARLPSFRLITSGGRGTGGRGHRRAQRVPPQEEVWPRAHAQALPVQALRAPVIELASVLHHELEVLLVHPHRRHLLVWHGLWPCLAVDHEDRPRRRASFRIGDSKTIVPGLGEQLHLGGLVEGRVALPVDLRLEQHRPVRQEVLVRPGELILTCEPTHCATALGGLEVLAGARRRDCRDGRAGRELDDGRLRSRCLTGRSGVGRLQHIRRAGAGVRRGALTHKRAAFPRLGRLQRIDRQVQGCALLGCDVILLREEDPLAPADLLDDPRLEPRPDATFRRAEYERGEGEARGLKVVGVEREGERGVDALLQELGRGAPIEEDTKLAAVLGGVVLVQHDDGEARLLGREQLLAQLGPRLAEVGLGCATGCSGVKQGARVCEKGWMGGGGEGVDGGGEGVE